MQVNNMIKALREILDEVDKGNPDKSKISELAKKGLRS